MTGATLIPTSASSALYKDAEKVFWSTWANPTTPKPKVVNVFYVNHIGQQVWFNYDDYRKTHGNEQYMWHGTTRACNIGDDNTQLNACSLPNCAVCHILRATLDPRRADPKSLFGIGAYVAPNSSKSVNPRYLRNADPSKSPNVVLLRCAVSLGNTFRATNPMVGVTAPPPGYDSISGVAGYTSLGPGGGTLQYDETVVFTQNAILPVEIIVLRFPSGGSSTHGDPYSAFTKKLKNVTSGNWNLYPEAIRDTYEGEILWTDGNDSYTFASAPRIKAYKVVRKDARGKVIAEGYASSNPFYFKLV
ncbi:hypothetical protein D9613_012708 [Agrocybe pediades]|uniref:PARP catalytic domain-containing protein n=1 Tax=Agrocybe pediades TaxID=84607 RepID=A0A8H4QK51_9AGAR|nr:hypothetical protein D9613_012708 [Agrocybe pediades]